MPSEVQGAAAIPRKPLDTQELEREWGGTRGCQALEAKRRVEFQEGGRARPGSMEVCRVKGGLGWGGREPRSGAGDQKNPRRVRRGEKKEEQGA